MSDEVVDISRTIIPKSDQLNADQLLAGPITVTITHVTMVGGDEQPVSVHYEGENGRPYKPCKTMRKLLVHAWGADASKWGGRCMTLFNEPEIKFGGEVVGGIRISHLSDIPSDIRVSLTSTRGKKALTSVKRMDAADTGHLAAIKAAATMDALRTSFEAAMKSTRSESLRARYTAVKDARKAKLQPPPRTDLPISDANATPPDEEN